MNLSKSLYTKGIQCYKALWLKKNKPEILTPPDASALARFEMGNIVGDLACDLFPNGKEIPYDDKNFDGMVDLTKQWMEEGLEYIYEATFLFDGILVLVDVLQNSTDGVAIYEVKSSSNMKDIYLDDISIQKYVLTNLGFNVKNSYLVYLDSSYIRDDELDMTGLFKVLDVSEEVNDLQASIPKKLSEFKSYLNDKENEPDIDIGKHCKKPYDCDAKAYCWKDQRGIPDYSIFNIFNLGTKKQIALYEQGIVKIENIPDDFSMTGIQKQKVANWKEQVSYIDKEGIKNFLDTLSYPIYHLDFETFQQAIPEWKGISPYQQIPFQYSLHIEYEDGTLVHKEFLAKEGEDPRYTLAQHLVSDIPNNVIVLAYYMSFEKGVICKLAETFPEFSSHLTQINENMKDLIVPFQKQYYVTPTMQGSASIKQVLPALIPEMKKAYKELDGIHNGTDAMNAFPKLTDMKPEEKERIRKALLEYCKLDTLAMVKILKKLREVIND